MGLTAPTSGLSLRDFLPQRWSSQVPRSLLNNTEGKTKAPQGNLHSNIQIFVHCLRAYLVERLHLPVLDGNSHTREVSMVTDSLRPASKTTI